MKNNIFKTNLWFIVSVIIFFLLILNLFIDLKPQKPVLLSEETKEKIINYINNNILRGKATASLVDVTFESDIYKLKLKIGKQEFISYLSKDSKIFFPEGILIEEIEKKKKEEKTTIGGFIETKDKICQKDGKPIVYYFGASNCPFCQWEKPIVDRVIEKFKENIAFYDNNDKNEDMDIFEKYSQGGIPTLVLGCRYYREGAGKNLGEEKEEKVLTKLICNLTKNQPQEVCEEVKNFEESN